MQLILGPSGSGKTALVLDRFRAALASGKKCVLLAPTATLVQHLQNQLTREGLVLRPQSVQTLSGFIEPWGRASGAVSDAALYLMVEAVAQRVNRPEFARVLSLPGFSASLAGAILEFASAGCSSARLAECLPDSPLGAAFLAVYQAVDRELSERGLALRGQRLLAAAARIEAEGLGGVESVWMDGFHALPDPELAVLRALDRRAGVTLALNEQSLTESLRRRLEAIGIVEERTGRKRGSPAVALVRAPGVEREAEEIARRILEQTAAGRPFREIGVIVRAADSYVPLLKSTFERFGIPARFYFDEALERHAAVRFLTGIVDALLSGWEHSATLAALRLAPRGAISNALDRFDFSVRERIPDRGLDGLRVVLRTPEGEPLSRGAEALLQELDQFAALEEWRTLSITPNAWAGRLRALRNLFRAAEPAEPATHDLALMWRSQALALNEFESALDDAALALGGGREVSLELFWRAAKSALRLRPLRVSDRRRNVVHVLSAHEARQWVLPVVFVCGMVERQFPQFHRPDAFFPETARRQLHRAGIRVRTAADFEAEEQALFDAAITRATLLVTLSYPEFDARGESTFPSMFLEGVAPGPAEARSVRPRPRNILSSELDPAIRSKELLAALRQKTATVNPSGLENYLQCPFQYFSGRTLRLKTAPKRPSERLDFLMQGIIVHDVLAKWWSARGDIAALFEEVFAQQSTSKRIGRSFVNECLRHAIRENLIAFAGDERWPRAGCTSETEREFTFSLADGIHVIGKIDRIDITSDGHAYVTDYKYSATVDSKAEDPNLLQAPLYLLAAERGLGLKPAGMEYVGLKKSVEVVGWTTPLPESFLPDAVAKTVRIVEEIRQGRIEPKPSNPERCRYCDFRDVCRIEVRKAELIVEHA